MLACYDGGPGAAMNLDHLYLHTWYARHQAWLRACGVAHHDPRGASPACADLRCANLRGASLRGANLAGANLTSVNLTGASLAGAKLAHAKLVRANLAGTSLAGADLAGADLAGTCLDPYAPAPPCTDEQLNAAHLEPRRVRGRDRVYGWRTATSVHVGTHEYTPGR